MRDYSLQGKVLLGASLPGGKPGALRWVDDAAVLNIALSTNEETRQESWSGNKRTTATLSGPTEATFNLTLHHMSRENLALALYGETRTVAAGSITGESFPPVADGDLVALDRGGISNVQITDSNATPATLTEDTHFRVDDVEGGVLEMLDTSTFTQPFLADYEHMASDDVTMFTAAPPIRYLLFSGLNRVDEYRNERVRARLYKMKFNPVSQLDLINESFGSLELSGTLLFEPTAALDDAFGGYGRMEQLQAEA